MSEFYVLIYLSFYSYNAIMQFLKYILYNAVATFSKSSHKFHFQKDFCVARKHQKLDRMLYAFLCFFVLQYCFFSVLLPKLEMFENIFKTLIYVI